MGAHHAPARRARRDAAHAATVAAPGIGRLAGAGVLTATAALALTGASSSVAFAHDTEASSDVFDDDVPLLCGILGGDECSSDSDDDSSRDSDAGSHDDVGSLFGGDALGSSSDSDADSDSDSRADDTDGSAGSDTSGRSSTRSADEGSASDARASSGTTQQDSRARARSESTPMQDALDTPPPPGQVRTIPVPG